MENTKKEDLEFYAIETSRQTGESWTICDFCDDCAFGPCPHK